MREEILANRLALKQLGYQEEDEQDYDEGGYQERLFQARIQRGNYGKIVDDVALSVAKAAFGSGQTGTKLKRHYFDGGANILQWSKSLVQNPGFKEGIIIGSVMLFRMGLWFSYRRAAKEGLEIVDL